MTSRSAAPVSRTAQYMALFRALETLRPPAERLFADPYARAFLPRAWAAAVRLATLRPVARALERAIDRRVAGARTSGIARTRLIDDRVTDAVAAGARQVVLLGAGFDTRALRLRELADVPVYEVDRAELLARKEEQLARRVGTSRARRIAVPVDFLRDDFSRALESAGFERGRPTALLCEGVTNYLDAAAVGALFRFAGRCARGSRFVFTYVHADVIRGRYAAADLAPLFTRLDELGEPWTFGFLPEELPAFCAERGLYVREDLGAAEYRSLALGARARGLSGYEFYRLAVAEVGRAADRG
ncbi:MAG TPA: SAM-dependent methyltransferase [Myxococcota bacterium]|nr:SAM-dependent methyltransferase [Myxococcota bacterium]